MSLARGLARGESPVAGTRAGHVPRSKPGASGQPSGADQDWTCPSVGEAAAALRPRNTAAPPATRLSARSAQPATVSPDARATWPPSTVSADIIASITVLPHSLTAAKSSGSAHSAQRSDFPCHVGADQQQPGEAEDQREERAGRLVDIAQLAAGVVVHGRAQLLHEPLVEAADQRIRHGLAVRQLRELVEGEEVQVPEQEQAGHDPGNHNQIAVALRLLRRPVGGRIDHRREMVLGDRRIRAVLLDPLCGCLGHGSIIARPARPPALAVHCEQAPIVWNA